MITIAHHPIVQSILDSWIAGTQPHPNEDDLHRLIALLEEKLNELGPIVDTLELLRSLAANSDLKPERQAPDQPTLPRTPLALAPDPGPLCTKHIACRPKPCA